MMNVPDSGVRSGLVLLVCPAGAGASRQYETPMMTYYNASVVTGF
jgi:hypothetical protein